MRAYFISTFTLLTACSEPKPSKEVVENSGNAEKPDPDQTGGDSGSTRDDYFDPAYLSIIAEFGWDSSTRSLVDVNTSTGPSSAHILLQYGDEDWAQDEFSPSSEHYCVVEIPFTQSALTSWVIGSSSYWAGFDYISADGLFTDCNLGDGVYDFDPNIWGDEPFSELPSYGWGMGVWEGPPDLASIYEGTGLETNVFGGTIPNSMLPYGEDDYVAVARQIDSEYNVVVEDDSVIFLPSNSINLGGNIASGWYLLLGGTWTFE